MASCIPKTDFCSKCTKETKYVCMNCRIPICNVCSYAEENDETLGWSSGRSVGYCGECSNEEGAENKISVLCSGQHWCKASLRKLNRQVFLVDCEHLLHTGQNFGELSLL